MVLEVTCEENRKGLIEPCHQVEESDQSSETPEKDRGGMDPQA